MADTEEAASSKANNPQSIDEKLKSLIRQMYIPFAVILLLVIGLFALFMVQYTQVSSNITTASRFNQQFKDEVDLKMYTFVSGSSTELPFAEVKTAGELAEKLLKVSGNREAHRTIQSVLSLCDNLYDSMIQIRNTVSYDERMQQLESNIYIITKLIEEYIYTYLYIEAGVLAGVKRTINIVIVTELLVAGTLMFLLFRRTARKTRSISAGITAPINELYDRVEEIGRGDLQAKLPVKAEDEILQSLSDGVEQMVQKLDAQMKLNNEEQLRLRHMELALIQAQINPHFLYNTLDAIVWLIETGKTEQAEKMIVSLSTYFRSFLSNGKEIITLAEEERHIRSYLEIQRVRYKDILDYQIDFDSTNSQCLIPKMTLQPLVENAIYHGIKMKRGGGTIQISDECDGKTLTLRVKDTGTGIPEETLAEIRCGLENGENLGFGITAAYKRLKLLFGEKCTFDISSISGLGTEITIRIPWVTEIGEEP
ncbi:MAG: sensor histidine kinase [Oscillospiraceae bacterium]|nr:sensor histidine kinase [Oscillospiraceae bacterium]